MAHHRGDEVEQIEVAAGDTFTLQSLGQAVVPPYLLIVPAIELPPILAVVREDDPEGEGVRRVTYTLRAVAPGQGTLRIGFRDLQSGEMVRDKSIAVQVTPPR
jgi:hypothetical protein